MTELRLIPTAAATPVAPPLRSQDASFKITAIGSCRIVGPLRNLQNEPQVILNQSGVYGYSHSCKEVRQHLTHLLSNTRPPDALMPVLAPNASSKDVAIPSHERSDFYVFELSSAKEISIDGHPVQLNYLNRHFRTFFSDAARARAFWAHARNSSVRSMRQFLADLPDYKSLPSEDQDLLAQTRLTMTSPDQLRRDIDAIQMAAPDHLFVTHFDALCQDGTLLKSRAAYLKMLRLALIDCDANWYDPSPSVHAFGQDLAIEDPQKSLSHYAPSFEQYLCSDWWMRFIDPVRRNRKMAETTKSRIRENAIAATARSVSHRTSFEKV